MTKPTKKPLLTKADFEAFAAALGRLGGSKNTPAQNAARAKNGRNGGCPPYKQKVRLKYWDTQCEWVPSLQVYRITGLPSKITGSTPQQAWKNAAKELL